MYDSYYFTGYSLSTYKCEKTTSCLDSCCPTGQKCIGGKCEVPPPPCKDNDGDGYNGKTSDCTTGTDCNDADASKWQLLSGYVDSDGDGYAAGSAVSVCSGSSLPSGYSASSLGSDCNDADKRLTNNCNVCGDGTAARSWSCK